MTKKRTFTKEEKLQILKEVEQNGMKPTWEKHGINLATCTNFQFLRKNG